MVRLTTNRFKKYELKNEIHHRLATFFDDQKALRKTCDEIGLSPYAIEDMVILKKNLHPLLLQIFSYYFNVNHQWLTWGQAERKIHSKSYPHELFWTHEADRVAWLLWTSGCSWKSFCDQSQIQETDLKKWINAAGRLEWEQCERISSIHPSQPGKHWAADQMVYISLDENGMAKYYEEKTIEFFRNVNDKPKVELLPARIKVNVSDYFLTKSV